MTIKELTKLVQETFPEELDVVINSDSIQITNLAKVLIIPIENDSLFLGEHEFNIYDLFKYAEYKTRFIDQLNHFIIGF